MINKESNHDSESALVNKEWIMTTGARKIQGMKGRLKAIFGGASASKTYSIIPMLINKAIENPGEVITIVSDTARNLRDGAMRDFIQIMQSFQRWDRNCWKASMSKYEFRNGSVIEFLGADEPDKFKGPRRDRLYVNEADRMKWTTFTQLNARTRKEVVIDWNPAAPFWYDWEVKGNMPHEWLRLTYLDNESLSSQEIAEFEHAKHMAKTSKFWENWWNVYGLGLNGQIEGACITDYNVLPNDEIPDGFQMVGIGLDFGTVDPNAAVMLYKHKEKEEFIFDEILYKTKQGIPSLNTFLEQYDTIIYGDYSHTQTINELRRLGRHIVKCKKGPDSIKTGIDLINSLNVSITPSSENLLNEIKAYAYKKDKNGLQEDGKYVGPDHLIDAMRYVLGQNIKKEDIKLYFI